MEFILAIFGICFVITVGIWVHHVGMKRAEAKIEAGFQKIVNAIHQHGATTADAGLSAASAQIKANQKQ
jgi:hypothetical protein